MMVGAQSMAPFRLEKALPEIPGVLGPNPLVSAAAVWLLFRSLCEKQKGPEGGVFNPQIMLHFQYTAPEKILKANQKD